jgi:hypothetical protein
MGKPQLLDKRTTWRKPALQPSYHGDIAHRCGKCGRCTSDGPQSLALTRVLRGERNRYQPWFLSLFTSCCAAKFALTRFKPIPHHRGVGGLVIRQSLREPTRLSRCSRCSYRLHPCGRGRGRESPCCTKRCPDSPKRPILMWYRVA